MHRCELTNILALGPRPGEKGRLGWGFTSPDCDDSAKYVDQANNSGYKVKCKQESSSFICPWAKSASESSAVHSGTFVNV